MWLLLSLTAWSSPFAVAPTFALLTLPRHLPVTTPAVAVPTTPQVYLFAGASYEIPTKHLTTGGYTSCGCVISVNLHVLPSAMRGKRSPSWRQRASISIRLLIVGRRAAVVRLRAQRPDHGPVRADPSPDSLLVAQALMTHFPAPLNMEEAFGTVAYKLRNMAADMHSYFQQVIESINESPHLCGPD